MERSLMPLLHLITALGWVLAFLLGAAIAVILLIRRRTPARWILTAAFAVGLVASVCNQVGFRALLNPQLRLAERIGLRGASAATLLGTGCGALAIAAIALGVWLLARETPAPENG